MGAGSGSGTGVALPLGLGLGDDDGDGIGDGVGVCDACNCLVFGVSCPSVTEENKASPIQPLNNKVTKRPPRFFFICNLPSSTPVALGDSVSSIPGGATKFIHVTAS